MLLVSIERFTRISKEKTDPQGRRGPVDKAVAEGEGEEGKWCGVRESNPHDQWSSDFKSDASTYFTNPASARIILIFFAFVMPPRPHLQPPGPFLRSRFWHGRARHYEKIKNNLTFQIIILANNEKVRYTKNANPNYKDNS